MTFPWFFFCARMGTMGKRFSRINCIIYSLLLAVLLAGCGKQPASIDVEKTTDTPPVSEAEATPLPSPVPTQVPTPSPTPDTSYEFTLCFAGDMSLAETAGTTQTMDASANGIFDCISADLMERMNAADIMCVNNEFTFSENGKPLEGKMYTFRGNPSRVSVLKDMGVDIANLANNHVYDYGRVSLEDTLQTLTDADIDYVGAGYDLAEAMSPVYYELDGKKVAIVAASRAEKFKMTPQATEDTPGILRCYDTELFLETIREADANADFVIAIVHWGTEYSYDLEEVQLTTGKEYLDAGADAIIGGHSHCLQGMEYYDGKPILYSLGNFWFNDRTLDTMLVELRFWGDALEDNLEVKVVPAIQKGFRTTGVLEESEQERIYEFLESISIDIEITKEGIVLPKED